MADYGGTRAYLPEPSAPAAARPRQAGPLLTALFGVALLGLVVIAYFDPLPTAAPTDYKVSGGGADVSPEQLAQLTYQDSEFRVAAAHYAEVAEARAESSPGGKLHPAYAVALCNQGSW